MRIVGGAHKGRPIVAPKGLDTRPTTDRTRESIFNILAHRDGIELDGARVIDLFAGSGALGLEAVSRGAVFCLFVETDSSARGAIRTNQETLGLAGVTRIHRRSATALGRMPAGMGEPLTLAFLDPPYRQGLVEPALISLRDGGWLSPGAICVVEQAKGEDAPNVDGFGIEDDRPMGDTVVRFLVAK